MGVRWWWGGLGNGPRGGRNVWWWMGERIGEHGYKGYVGQIKWCGKWLDLNASQPESRHSRAAGLYVRVCVYKSVILKLVKSAVEKMNIFSYGLLIHLNAAHNSVYMLCKWAVCLDCTCTYIVHRIVSLLQLLNEWYLGNATSWFNWKQFPLMIV